MANSLESMTVAQVARNCHLIDRSWTSKLTALFHGFDFRRILVPQREYGARLFLYPLLVMPIAAFVVGSVFGLFSNWLGGLGRATAAK